MSLNNNFIVCYEDKAANTVTYMTSQGVMIPESQATSDITIIHNRSEGISYPKNFIHIESLCRAKGILTVPSSIGQLLAIARTILISSIQQVITGSNIPIKVPSIHINQPNLTRDYVEGLYVSVRDAELYNIDVKDRFLMSNKQLFTPSIKCLSGAGTQVGHSLDDKTRNVISEIIINAAPYRPLIKDYDIVLAHVPSADDVSVRSILLDIYKQLSA